MTDTGFEIAYISRFVVRSFTAILMAFRMVSRYGFRYPQRIGADFSFTFIQFEHEVRREDSGVFEQPLFCCFHFCMSLIAMPNKSRGHVKTPGQRADGRLGGWQFLVSELIGGAKRMK